MRTPSREEKAREAAVLYTTSADLVIVMLMFTLAAGSSSLTLLSEAIRGALMLFIEFYALFVLRAVHRDRLRKFRFGIGKVEQMCHLAIGAALLGSAFWIAHNVVAALFITQGASTPLGLAAAATVSAINLMINLLGWLAMVAATGHNDSAIFRSQLRARLVKLVSSAIVQCTITVAALAKDPAVATLFDCIGATFVYCVMGVIGSRMIVECLPHLLDQPVAVDTMREIEAGLMSAGVTNREVARIRTRRAGQLPQVEITLELAGCASLADYSRRAERIEAWMQDHLRCADVSVVVDAAES